MCEACFGLMRERRLVQYLTMNQQTVQLDLRVAQTSKISKSISVRLECFLPNLQSVFVFVVKAMKSVV